MLEDNYRTWASQNDIVLDDGPPEAVGDPDAMEIEAPAPEPEPEWDGFDGDDDVPAFFKEETEVEQKLKEKGAGRKRKGKVAELVREKVRVVLEDHTKLGEKRARMMDQGDFLKLLWSFNQEGIHFS
ncbi:MAG: Dimethyladenosine transferase [Stictis urceolatum]|nr:Dimethyladenosine transferase [Stictis urceolata]